MIAGLAPITNGQILIGGTTIDKARRAIGLVLQRPALLPWRTTIENVLLPAEMLNLNMEESRNRARRLLAWFGLTRFEACRADALPAGMANAVSVCRALVHTPSLLLMDEPFRILDALVHEQVLDGFQRLWAENKTTAVLCTRNLFEAVLLSDRVIVLSSGPGRILEIISVDLSRPRRLDKTITPQITDYCNRIRMVLRAQGSVP
jgi:NitT/TauT family transport system ATP-binding protein